MLLAYISSVALSNKGFIVFLKEQEGERSLPIFIGPLEAKSIASRLNKEEFPRPLTHDLFKSTLDELGARVTHIEVTDLQENTFYGKVYVAQQDMTYEIDARPSDAIALALRFDAQVFIADHVMEEAGEVIEEQQEEHPETEHLSQQQNPSEKEQQEYDSLSEAEKLKRQLEKAIKEERYEEAARLRDRINEEQNQGN